MEIVAFTIELASRRRLSQHVVISNVQMPPDRLYAA